MLSSRRRTRSTLAGQSLAGLSLGLWLMACGQGAPWTRACTSDPQLRAQLAAADAWDQGKAALSAGQTDAAVARFAAAQALDPASPSLPAWRARALELGGDDAAAVAVLDQALGRFPDDVDLRFNRAALRARRGDLEGAGADLRRLVRAGAVRPSEAATDPDLAALQQVPALAELVAPQPVELTASGESGSVLLGDAYDAEILIDAPNLGPLAVQDMGEAAGLLQRRRVVEDRLDAPKGHTLRRVAITWRAVSPGQGALGPWLVVAGGSSGLTQRMPVEVIAVGSRDQAAGEAAGETLVIPSQVIAERSPPWVGELDGALVVLVPADVRVEVRDAAQPLSPIETWELRDGGRPRWQALRFALPMHAQVVARDGRRVILDQDWPPK